MKMVLLLAGIGKRLGEITKHKNKSLIKLLDKPLLGHLLDRLVAGNQKEILIIIGHKGKGIVDFIDSNYKGVFDLKIVENKRYKEANNMYSVWCAKEFIKGKEFILCNGDIILNKFILEEFVKSNGKSEIMLDIKNRLSEIDSPGTIIKNDRIFDLGRHISKDDNGGYAIGLYKFNSDLSIAYFNEIEKMLQDNKYNAGFHDPLTSLFHNYEVFPASTNGLSWTDIDTKEDITRAENVLRKIIFEEKNL
jgi:choline kinase